MADFHTRFKELAHDYPGTDEAVARALGVSKQTVGAWKSGLRSPKRPTAMTIAKFFGVSLPYLMGETDERELPQRPAHEDAAYVMLARGAQEATAEERRRMLQMMQAAFPQLFENG